MDACQKVEFSLTTDFDINAPSVFANGHGVGHAFELCDPLSPSLRPMGETRRQEGEERRSWRGQTRKKAEGTLTPPPPTFRSQRDTSQTSRINLKDCVTWAAEQLKGFSSYRFKWEFKSGHFMPVLGEHFTVLLQIWLHLTHI